MHATKYVRTYLFSKPNHEEVVAKNSGQRSLLFVDKRTLELDSYTRDEWWWKKPVSFFKHSHSGDIVCLIYKHFFFFLIRMHNTLLS